MNFNIDGKKLKSHICLKDFNNRHKIVKDGSRILNIINGHFALLPEELRSEYYLYRMINVMVYTPHLPNYSNVQVPS